MMKHNFINTLPIEHIAKRIDIPLERWAGNCAAIAHALVAHGLVEGEEMRGFWIGPISPKSTFYGHPLAQHSWIETDDGTIVDPTRFAFEDVKPYIYAGENDFYDAGGNIIKEAFMRPCPTEDVTAHLFALHVDPATAGVLIELANGQFLKYDKGIMLNIDQIFWLANLPLHYLGLAAKPLYTALEEIGYKAAIPIDNYRMVMK